MRNKTWLRSFSATYCSRKSDFIEDFNLNVIHMLLDKIIMSD